MKALGNLVFVYPNEFETRRKLYVLCTDMLDIIDCYIYPREENEAITRLKLFISSNIKELPVNPKDRDNEQEKKFQFLKNILNFMMSSPEEDMDNERGRVEDVFEEPPRPHLMDEMLVANMPEPIAMEGEGHAAVLGE